MLMLNVMLLAAIGIWLTLLTLPVVPLRYIAAFAIWTPAAINSDFVKTFIPKINEIGIKSQQKLTQKWNNW